MEIIGVSNRQGHSLAGLRKKESFPGLRRARGFGVLDVQGFGV